MLTEILSLENDIKPFLGKNCCSDVADVRLLGMIRQWIENAARQHVKFPITQETITGELQRKDDIGYVSDWDMVDVVGDKVYLGGSYGQGGHFLQLDNGFVRSITTLHEDLSAEFGTGGTDFAAGTLLVQGTDFAPEFDASGMCKSGRILRINRNWSSRPGTIKITYVCGLTAAELADEYSFVKLALLEDVQDKFSTIKSRQSSGGGPLKKVTYQGDVTEEYATGPSTMSLQSLSPGAKMKLQPIVRVAL